MLYTSLLILTTSINIYGIEKPTSSMKFSQVEKICKQWALKAKRQGRSQLVIGIEGLSSFNQKYADLIYQYENDLRVGKKSTMPEEWRMNFISKNIIRTTMKNYIKKSDFLLMPERSEHETRESVSQRCVKSWFQVHGEDFKLVVVGHSFGANAARRLTQKLESDLPALDNIYMLTIDARTRNPFEIQSKFYTPQNVRQNYVYYQKYTPFLWGYAFDEKENTSNKKMLKGDFASTEVCRGNSHARITCAPEVISTFKKLLDL